MRLLCWDWAFWVRKGPNLTCSDATQGEKFVDGSSMFSTHLVSEISRSEAQTTALTSTGLSHLLYCWIYISGKITVSWRHDGVLGQRPAFDLWPSLVWEQTVPEADLMLNKTMRRSYSSQQSLRETGIKGLRGSGGENRRWRTSWRRKVKGFRAQIEIKKED